MTDNIESLLEEKNQLRNMLILANHPYVKNNTTFSDKDLLAEIIADRDHLRKEVKQLKFNLANLDEQYDILYTDMIKLDPGYGNTDG